jgi:hypothetical protein
MTATEAERAIAQNVDRLRVHSYRRQPDFQYVSRRLTGLFESKPNLPVSIIFSAEPEFMRDWLQQNSMAAAEAEFTKQLSGFVSREHHSGMKLEGFTYFAYGHSKRVAPE